MKKLVISISIFITLFLILGGYFVYTVFSGTSSPISINFDTPKKLKSTDGRTNILAIGVDTRDSNYLQTGTLTDTLIVISVDLENKNIKFLSLPRDIWVEIDNRGMKINEVYTLVGPESLKQTIEELLGIDIHYTAKADFGTVIKIVDSLEGITINNPKAFTDNYYPKFGWENETCGIDANELEKEKEKEWEEENQDKEDAIKPNTFLDQYDFPCRFEAISFSTGEIILSGEEALKYARSRHSFDTDQGTDFARARRQQLVILAIKDKILSKNVLTNINKLRNVYSNMAELLETDFTINELITAAPFIKDSNEFSIESRVLSNMGKEEEGGVLVQGIYESYGGRYVLIPETQDSIITFVNEYFYAIKPL